jgi:hypothetical protein
MTKIILNSIFFLGWFKIYGTTTMHMLHWGLSNGTKRVMKGPTFWEG